MALASLSIWNALALQSDVFVGIMTPAKMLVGLNIIKTKDRCLRKEAYFIFSNLKKYDIMSRVLILKELL